MEFTDLDERNLKSVNNVFEDVYTELYGSRWPVLRNSLLTPKQKVVLNSSFEEFSPEQVLSQWQKLGLHISMGPIVKGYELDAASLVPVLALAPESGQTVLDMCAAPGGKSLALVNLSRGLCHYQINEHSMARSRRLRMNLKENLPEEIFLKLNLSKVDASRIGLRHRDQFDRILLDAPCSGERYILTNKRDYLAWKPSRTKFLSGRQFSMICAASDALAPGGRLVYSTCSISRLENDAVIEKLLDRREAMEPVSWCPPQIDGLEIENLKYGFAILPDRSSGSGPIYFAILGKRADEFQGP